MTGEANGAAALTIRSAAEFERFLIELTDIDATLSPATYSAVERLIEALGPAPSVPESEALAHFYGRLNWKLGANADTLRAIYATAARSGVTFNYHAKKAISTAVDTGDSEAFGRALKRYCPDGETRTLIEQDFDCVSHAETCELLVAETVKPSKLRKALAREVATDVLDAAAGCLVWSLWAPTILCEYFDEGNPADGLSADYLAGLRRRYPAIFQRNRSLVVRNVRIEAGSERAYRRHREELTSWVANEFELIDNYGHLAFVLDVEGGSHERTWELAADLTLFAERFLQEPFERLYFRSKDIEAETAEHISTLDTERAAFNVAFEGFTYRDLFVLHDEDGEVVRLLLLFQKNRRDETPIPCPACRSTRVEGNSYPTLGVKSWECSNLLCPERSIYNRGKRYSFKALLTQAAIEQVGNEIPVASIGRWRRDVLPFISDDEVIEMLVRHYSMLDDVIVSDRRPTERLRQLGRNLKVEEFEPGPASRADFWASPFFERYATPATPGPAHTTASLIESPTEPWSVLEGDALDVLRGLPDGCVDRAVTSPPYFNAREYAQWPNLYCYLYDMRLIHEEVLRVLQPGALYAFNVFDYFDNERTITFSAMGQKRLSLSALFVDLFRRIGFASAGCVVWDKGHVEGKRAFNAGNPSPFYQSPINCWEHVLIFRKPGRPARRADLDVNRVLQIKPVMKMVRGENRHGHTAPFPVELPAAMLGGLEEGALVLDPFGGSGTTARAALDRKLRSLLIERDGAYVELSRRLIDTHIQETSGDPPRLF
jgi:DNA modification methylase